MTSKPLHRYIESRFDSRFADPPGLIRVLGALSRLKPKEKSAIARGAITSTRGALTIQINIDIRNGCPHKTPLSFNLK
ncbi:MAG: hypothetical protein DME87_07655 [Verrucomicrobia bacterium]|nr:MAG: hypothetical protein DME87_07655 [Verrucomicrobiota bacterium]